MSYLNREGRDLLTIQQRILDSHYPLQVSELAARLDLEHHVVTSAVEEASTQLGLHKHIAIELLLIFHRAIDERQGQS